MILFILVNVGKDFNGKFKYDVLDTDDLVCESFVSEHLKDLYKRIPNLSITGIKYDSSTCKLSFVQNQYGTKFYKINKNYALVAERKKSVRGYLFYYNLMLYRRGTDEPIWYSETPTSSYDYLSFCFENFDNYICIEACAYDKHYYREDCGEEFYLGIVLDISSERAKIIRKDDKFIISNKFKLWQYDVGGKKKLSDF